VCLRLFASPCLQIHQLGVYGFPESHAGTFALIAYASAYFKVKYLAAFTCAILNNQPMGFYMPAVLVKDAQRHGLRVKPIDVQVSDWPCTIEHEKDCSLSLRLGLGYTRGLRKQAAEALVNSLPSGSGPSEAWSRPPDSLQPSPRDPDCSMESNSQ
jgi:error-prone DNA polymerase